MTPQYGNNAPLHVNETFESRECKEQQRNHSVTVTNNLSVMRTYSFNTPGANALPYPPLETRAHQHASHVLDNATLLSSLGSQANGTTLTGLASNGFHVLGDNTGAPYGQGVQAIEPTAPPRKCISSYGIALVRQNATKGCELLFIRKRASYAYITFVKGAYGRNNDIEIAKLFNSMTLEEKVCILSMDFSKIWYFSYLIHPHRLQLKELTKYETYKSKFEKRFLVDNGERLKRLMRRTKNIELIWEMPKGMMNKYESPVQTAVREFYEETSIRKNKYRILWDAKPYEHVFSDEGVTYRYVYYLAEMLDHKFVPSIDPIPPSYSSSKIKTSNTGIVNIPQVTRSLLHGAHSRVQMPPSMLHPLAHDHLHVPMVNSSLETSNIKFCNLEEIYWLMGKDHAVSKMAKKLIRMFKNAAKK